MSVTFYEITYLITQILGTYSVYKFISSFFDEPIFRKSVTAISFSFYYIIVALVYFRFNVPIITFFTNIILFFLLTFNFQGKMKQRLLATTMTYMVCMCCELIVVTITGYIHFPLENKNDYKSVFGQVAINLLCFTISIAVNRLKRDKRYTEFSRLYWFAIIIIPLSTLVVMFTVLTNMNLSKTVILVNISLILVINFFAFFLFEKIAVYSEQEKQRQLIIQQNAYYLKQLQLMESSLETTKSLRHDVKNHMAAIYTSLENGHISDAKKHIESVMNVYKNNSIVSGNSAIDSIVNFKDQEAHQAGLSIAFNIDIPTDINIEAYDAAIILGNLLDNSIEAVGKESVKDKTIGCDIKYNKGVLLIDIKNHFDGKILHKGNSYISTKSDKEMHGLGLRNVKNSVEKYNGSMDITHKHNVYEVYIMLYL